MFQRLKNEELLEFIDILGLLIELKWNLITSGPFDDDIVKSSPEIPPIGCNGSLEISL
jgi:hypothetical protein